MILTVGCKAFDHVLITSSFQKGPDSNLMHSVKFGWHYPLIRVFRHSFELILQSSLKPQSESSTLFADQESFMRAFDIICVSVLTKLLLLLPSDVSSTPTKYSTSNSHSLISGDTHDGIRSLRVDDESNTQERAPYSNFDSLLKYIPWTNAAEIARVKDLLSMSTSSRAWIDNFCNKLLADEEHKWANIMKMLGKDIKPKSLRLFLSRHLSNKDEINSIIDPHTTLYSELETYKSSKKKTLSQHAYTVVIINKMRYEAGDNAEQHVLKKFKVSEDKVGDWISSLLRKNARWDQYTELLVHDINPSDIKKILWKHQISSETIEWFSLSYTKLYENYKANQAKLSMDDNTLQAFVQTFKKQDDLQKAREKSESDFKKWLSNLDNFLQFKSNPTEKLTSLVKNNVDSEFIKELLQKRMSILDGIMSDADVGNIMNVYKSLLADFKTKDLSLEKPAFDDDISNFWNEWHNGNSLHPR